jgi:hypothetical protein
MGKWQKADCIAERVLWAAVSVACGIAVWALYSWSDGHVISSLFASGSLSERLNGMVAVAGLIGVGLYGSYQAMGASRQSTDGS